MRNTNLTQSRHGDEPIGAFAASTLQVHRSTLKEIKRQMYSRAGFVIRQFV